MRVGVLPMRVKTSTGSLQLFVTTAWRRVSQPSGDAGAFDVFAALLAHPMASRPTNASPKYLIISLQLTKAVSRTDGPDSNVCAPGFVGSARGCARGHRRVW